MLTWNLGWVMRKNEPMEDSEKENLHLQFSDFIMADADIPFPSKLGKLETQTLGVSNLKFFCAIDIKEMAAIFQIFHNGRC